VVRIGDLPAKSAALSDAVLTVTFDSLPATNEEPFLVVENETTTRDITVVARSP